LESATQYLTHEFFHSFIFSNFWGYTFIFALLDSVLHLPDVSTGIAGHLALNAWRLQPNI